MAQFILLIKNSNQYTSQRWYKAFIITVLASIYAFWTMFGAGQENVFYGCLFFFSAFPAYVILYKYLHKTKMTSAETTTPVS